MARLTVLGLDPGKDNHAFCVCQFDIETGLKYKLVTTGMIKCTIKELIGISAKEEAKKYRRELQALVKKYDVDVIIAERFQNRGRMFGNSSELVNIMLGVLLNINVEVRLITASQWKNAFNKIYTLKDFYKEVPLVAHRIDASLIGIYGSSFFTNTKHFDCIKLDIAKCRLRITKTE
jgi:Holliday junction resolvasome RuvABC endonuclease subunit